MFVPFSPTLSLTWKKGQPVHWVILNPSSIRGIRNALCSLRSFAVKTPAVADAVVIVTVCIAIHIGGDYLAAGVAVKDVRDRRASVGGRVSARCRRS
jgi:hypothetical protein